MPILVSNRSFFCTSYMIEGSEAGEFQFIVSGLGNDKFKKKHAKLIKNDVFGTFNVNYLGIKPMFDQYGDVIGTHVQ